MKTIFSAIICLILFCGCASSTFTSKPENARIKIGKTDISGEGAVTGRIPRTTFGKYPVKVEKAGYQPFYAMLPLNVSGGVIALDVLLFAPATFFNVQGPFYYYEFDLDKELIRYKDEETEDWKEYRIPFAEKDRARRHFE